MKHTKILFSLLFLGTLAFMLSSCNLQEPVSSADPEPQLVQNDPGAIFCKACAEGCILGYDFTTADIDGNHPQGGYKLAVVWGKCECEKDDGRYYAKTTGSVVTQVGQIGGPASGSLPSPVGHAWLLFNFGCSGGGGIIGGGITVGQSWEHFVHQVSNTYTGPPSPGVLDWPNSWNVTVSLPDPASNVQVKLPNPAQSQLLTQVNLYSLSDEAPIATISANGASEYALDLSELPVGHYNVELKFAPGFSLYTPLYRYTTGG